VYSSKTKSLCRRIKLYIKVATLSSDYKDKFRMIVSMTVSNFVKFCQVLTILH